MLDIGLYLSYLLLGLATVAAIVLPAINIARNRKSLVQSGIGVGALTVLFVIAYALSGDEVSASAAALGITPTVSRLIGAGLIMYYITQVVAVLGLVYSEVNKALN